MAVAVKAVTVDVPPRFNVPFVLLINVPLPVGDASAVETVRVPVLVKLPPLLIFSVGIIRLACEDE